MHAGLIILHCSLNLQPCPTPQVPVLIQARSEG
jgi:hypothetical protein